jgi:hypothetical protein
LLPGPATAHRRVTPVLQFLLSRRSFALFWIPARAPVLELGANNQGAGPPKQGSFTINTSFPGLPWLCVLFPAPRGARGARARGRGWAWGTTRGRARPPRGLFGERGLGRGGEGGGVSRLIARGELGLKGGLSVGFPAAWLGGFPCASGAKNGREMAGRCAPWFSAHCLEGRFPVSIPRLEATSALYS